jgi:hypothetical protein
MSHHDDNSLLITESETPSDLCHENKMCEMFGFSEESRVSLADEKQFTKRNSLIIVEEGDLKMDQTESNESEHIHRLSVQVDSGDGKSLVMTNEAINQTVIKIGSNDSNDDFESSHEPSNEKVFEAVNNEIEDNFRRNSHSFAAEGDNAIVSILGQINDIVG